MAQHTIPPLDAFVPVGHDEAQTRMQPRSLSGEDAGTAFSDLESKLSGSVAGKSLADLALDLVLNEIVQEARLSTTATGATIRLVYEGEVVCRAAAGATAAEIAAYLKPRAGIVGACLQTGAVQRCDDAEIDSRVEAVVCRRLGLRSILIVPVRNAEGQTLGIIEVFSARVRAFSDRDVLALQALSRRVLANIDLVARIMPPAAAGPLSAASVGRRLPRESRVSDSGLQLVPRITTHSARHRMLLLVLVAPAVLAGWFLGRAGRGQVSVGIDTKPDMSYAAKLPSNSLPASTGAAVVATANQVAAATAPVSGPSNVTAKGKNPPDNAASAKISKARSPATGTSGDGLVVYENYNLVSEMRPLRWPAESAGAAATHTSIEAASRDDEVRNHPLLLPETIASTYLVGRIEPQYPTRAIEQHIQGRVTLAVGVNKEGAVRGIRLISGDPLLTAAAADAVRQWHFKPYLRNRQPMNFESHITLNFALP